VQKRILLIQGHPDAAHPHLCGALEHSVAGRYEPPGQAKAKAAQAIRERLQTVGRELGIVVHP
jgi:hypothetical protein